MEIRERKNMEKPDKHGKSKMEKWKNKNVSMENQHSKMRACQRYSRTRPTRPYIPAQETTSRAMSCDGIRTERPFGRVMSG
jgi:hypothetical protein